MNVNRTITTRTPNGTVRLITVDYPGGGDRVDVWMADENGDVSDELALSHDEAWELTYALHQALAQMVRRKRQ